MKIDFATLLVLLAAGTGLIWLVDSYVLYPMKMKKLSESTEYDSKTEPIRRSWVVENARSIFPIIFAVLVLRSFLVEPFRIPSESMMPTLIRGDFILVNKFSYGLRLPAVNWKILGIGKPRRGDVAVFRYPLEPSVDYIKRVIGLPGDQVVYTPDKKLYLDGVFIKQWVDVSAESSVFKRQLIESIGDKQYTIYLDDRIPISQTVDERRRIPETAPESSELCQGWNTCWMWQVPEGHYLMMGDNRDGSSDGRSWGFVPEELLVGRASLILFHFDLEEFSAKGSRIFKKIR